MSARQEIVLIAHNLRSTHNVGSLLRTGEGLGISQVFLTGYTPFPAAPDDPRLPHIRDKINNQIHKTALGAEENISWTVSEQIEPVLRKLKNDGFTIAGLEQDPHSIPLQQYNPPERVALIVGREVEGIEPDILELCDTVLEIPMAGRKESFNVAQACAMALFHLKYGKVT